MLFPLVGLNKKEHFTSAHLIFLSLGNLKAISLISSNLLINDNRFSSTSLYFWARVICLDKSKVPSSRMGILISMFLKVIFVALFEKVYSCFLDSFSIAI